MHKNIIVGRLKKKRKKIRFIQTDKQVLGRLSFRTFSRFKCTSSFLIIINSLNADCNLK